MIVMDCDWDKSSTVCDKEKRPCKGTKTMEEARDRLKDPTEIDLTTRVPACFET